MGKGGFYTTTETVVEAKTYGKEALEMCGFFYFDEVSSLKKEEEYPRDDSIFEVEDFEAKLEVIEEEIEEEYEEEYEEEDMESVLLL